MSAAAVFVYAPYCTRSCLSRGCNCEVGHGSGDVYAHPPTLGELQASARRYEARMEQAVATADRLATLPEGSHVDRSGGYAADNDDRLMRTIYLLVEETPTGDRFPLIGYTDKAKAEKERERRQTRLDAVGVIQGAAAVSTYYIHDLPLDEGTA